MTHSTREKLIYLRQWVGENVYVLTTAQCKYTGLLTNIVFDGTRLMYIILDDRVILNFEHIVEISINKQS